MQPKAKSDLQNIWMAETHKKAKESFDAMVFLHSAKYPKAMEKLKNIERFY